MIFSFFSIPLLMFLLFTRPSGGSTTARASACCSTMTRDSGRRGMPSCPDFFFYIYDCVSFCCCCCCCCCLNVHCQNSLPADICRLLLSPLFDLFYPLSPLVLVFFFFLLPFPFSFFPFSFFLPLSCCCRITSNTYKHIPFLHCASCPEFFCLGGGACWSWTGGGRDSGHASTGTG